MNKAIEKLLEENKLKKTNGHIIVLGLLLKEKRPLTIDQINKKIKNKINTTTVYRILDKFSEKKIIYKTNFLDGKSYFEFQDHHHHHITCTKCGDRDKIDFCVLSHIKKINLSKTNFSNISGHILEFFGPCKKCKKI